MKKEFWILIILATIIVVLLCVLIFIPAKPKPAIKESGIVITSPKANEEISIPFKIAGYVAGDGWAGFEGQVGAVELVQNSMQPNEVMASAALKATSDWTVLPTNFEADISDVSANINIGMNASLIFHNENPSGDPAKDKTFILPVKIKSYNVK